MVVLLECALMLLQGCVATYQPMAFDYTPLNSTWNAVDDPQLHMAIDYDVLTEPGMKRYAAMERKNKVNLVIVTIQNTGSQEFLLSRDVVFQSSGGMSIIPLSIEAAMTALVGPVTDNPKNSAVEVEAPASWDLIWGAGKAANTSKTIVSHVRFANDMSGHYIADTPLTPGSIKRGLLVLPIVRGSVVTTTLQQRSE